MLNIGNKISQTRKNQNITQEKFAEKSDVGLSTIKNVESGKNITIENLIKIAKALNVSLEYLLNEKNEGKTMDKEPKAEYILSDQTSEGFREFLNDEDTMLLITPTEEELEWLKKSVVFMPEDKPTKQTYIDLLLTYRKLKKK